jgi:MFS family permease
MRRDAALGRRMTRMIASHSTEPRGSDYPPPAYALYVLVVLVLTTLLSYTDRHVLSLLVDPVRRDLDISDTQVGLLLGTAFGLVYGVAGLPSGYFADRTSRRNLIIGGILVWSLGTVLCGTAVGFASLFLCRMVVGIGESMLIPASISLISDYFSPRHRGTAVGVFLSGIALGSSGAIFFGGLVLRLVETVGVRFALLHTFAPWRLVLLLLGVGGLLPTVALLVSVGEPHRHRDVQAVTPRDVPSATVTEMANWRRVAPLLLGVALISLVDNGVLAWTPSLLIREFGWSPGRVGSTLGILLMLAGSIGVFSGSFLRDSVRARFGLRGQFVFCLAAALLAAPLAAIVLSRHADAVVGGVAACMVLSGVITGAGLTAILDTVPGERRGFVTAISFFLNVALGAGIGPPAVAALKDHVLAPGTSLAVAIGGVWCLGFLVAGVGFFMGARDSLGAAPMAAACST